jgi:sterol desaturase/sphingolipid hydroxylase (fatty acid hydroxylase superfamily)
VLYASGVYSLLLWPPVRWITAPIGPALSVRHLPPAAQWIIAFLAVDLAAYFAHRAAHANRFLWRFHRIHHSDSAPNALTAFRCHVIEVAWRLLARALPLQLLGVDPASMPIGLFVIPLVLEIVAHANVPWSFPLFVSPAYHRVHHGADESESRHNFAMLLPLWDALFGTMAAAATPAAFGLRAADVVGETWWDHLTAKRPARGGASR